MVNILVVDDEKSIRTTFEVFLSHEGYQVFLAPDVEYALDIVNQTHIDLIITDIIMPRLTGLDMIKTLNETGHDIPVVLMTGEPSVETAKQAIKDRVYDYLIKPVDKNELLKTTRYILQQSALIKENMQLENTLEGAISTICQILEAKDPYTAGHMKNVAKLSAAIAKKMNLPEAQQKKLSFAGYLHDIGKLMIPSEILSKPGKISSSEFAIIKEHVIHSFELMNNGKFPSGIAEIIKQHHERLDGSGYPDGLKADEILFEAKILAVADMVEAMTSHRPYRPGYGLDAALNEITTNKGVLYDSDVVDATIDLFKEDHYQIDSIIAG